MQLLFIQLFLFFFHYFKFDVFNIGFYLFTVGVMYLFKNSEVKIKQWIIHLLIAFTNLILAFYAMCYGHISNEIYIYFLGIYLIMSLIFKLNSTMIFCIGLIFIVDLFFDNGNCRSYLFI